MSLLSARLQETVETVRKEMGDSDDIVIRIIESGAADKRDAALLFTDGLVNTQDLQQFVMEPLMFHLKDQEDRIMQNPDQVITMLQKAVLTAACANEIDKLEDLLEGMLSGQAIVLIDGCDKALSIDMAGWKERNVTESESQTVVRGPREAFTENIRTNTSLVRRKIKDPRLRVESMQVGKVTKTAVALLYIQGIADEKVVQEARDRLSRIQIDSVLESAYIEEQIEEKRLTPFPTVFNSERPDVIAAGLLEGRVAIMVDGTPYVLMVPALFVQFYQSAEDYYQRADISTLLRILRLIAMFVALFAPSIYVAVTTYHQEMIPTQLLMSLASQREGVPFPAIVEAIMMEITFEILREAGIRMPKSIGQAISIVGTLVIGQAAVDAGIVSAAMVIVVAITAISSFIVPSYSFGISIRMLRFILMFLGATFGLFGITAGFIAISLHLCSLHSFGVPYMSPFAPFNPQQQKDAILRLPRWGIWARKRSN